MITIPADKQLMDNYVINTGIFHTKRYDMFSYLLIYVYILLGKYSHGTHINAANG